VYLNRFICGTPQPSCHRLLARIERGYNVLTFDGPGQYGPIHRERMPFRTDWEAVVTPIVDFALSLPGVDPERIVLMGVSMGGVLAPRAAAFEKRIAALVANDGIYDFGAPQIAAVPPDQREAFVAALNQKEAPELDRVLEESMNRSPTSKWAGEHSRFVMGESTAHATFAKVLKFNLRDGIAEKIACPTLVLEAEDHVLQGSATGALRPSHLPEDSHALHGGGGRRRPLPIGAHRLAFGRIYDWLDDTLRDIA
jgi:pimeloyl-ACP methyl ester carboxylesterase